jgi:hypothetical protein
MMRSRVPLDVSGQNTGEESRATLRFLLSNRGKHAAARQQALSGSSEFDVTNRSAVRECPAETRSRHRRHLNMTSFLDLLEIAAARGDGLHPKLLQLCEGKASAPQCDTVTRIDGMIQSRLHAEGFEHARNAVVPQRGPSPAAHDEK